MRRDGGGWIYRTTAWTGLDAVRLVDSPVMRNLVALDLAGNRLGDNGASVLADSPTSPG